MFILSSIQSSDYQLPMSWKHKNLTEFHTEIMKGKNVCEPNKGERRVVGERRRVAQSKTEHLPLGEV